MKIVALIPYWLEYQVNELGFHKNLKKLAGKYLINYSIEVLNSIKDIEETIIYCSNEKIKSYINSELSYTFLQRDKHLDSSTISIDTIIQSFLDDYDCDIIVLLHPNSPFLNSTTIKECLNNVKNKQFDSAFTAYKYNKFSWFKGKPLNYSLKKETPSLYHIEPLIIEQSSLYIFEKTSFLNHNKRIGNSPYIKFINHFEGHEIITNEDFEMAELIVNSGMYPKVNYEDN